MRKRHRKDSKYILLAAVKRYSYNEPSRGQVAKIIAICKEYNHPIPDFAKFSYVIAGDYIDMLLSKYRGGGA